MADDAASSAAPARGGGAAASSDLPWVEKYRPRNLSDLVAHEEIISTINRLIDANKLPHLLLYGPPGTGKTSTVLACARRLYGDNLSSMVLELNASDDRGINVVRDQIQSFAGTRKLFSSGVKLVILDEADAMTQDAQFALRRVIEKYTKNTRFCLICNYVNKIIPALQSRCTRFRFAPLQKSQMVDRTRMVIEAERISVTDDGLEAVLQLSGGDMRKVLNVLQSASLAFDTVDARAVYLCTGSPFPEDIQQAMERFLNSPVAEAFEFVRQLQVERGLALVDILTEISKYTMRVQLPRRVRMRLLDRLMQIEYNLAFGTSEKAQLGALVGAFALARSELEQEVS